MHFQPTGFSAPSAPVPVPVEDAAPEARPPIPRDGTVPLAHLIPPSPTFAHVAPENEPRAHLRQRQGSKRLPHRPEHARAVHLERLSRASRSRRIGDRARFRHRATEEQRHHGMPLPSARARRKSRTSSPPSLKPCPRHDSAANGTPAAFRASRSSPSRHRSATTAEGFPKRLKASRSKVPGSQACPEVRINSPRFR